jgi:hypothetical protein
MLGFFREHEGLLLAKLFGIELREACFAQKGPVLAAQAARDAIVKLNNMEVSGKRIQVPRY